MSVTQKRTLGIFALSATLIAVLSISIDARAGKKKKAGKGKDTAADVVDNAQQAAREHYAKGKSLYEEGNFAESLTEFTAAYDTKPHPTVLKSIAECQRQLGDILGAVASLEKYLESPDAVDKESVEKDIEELKMTPVNVMVTSVPDNAELTIAGQEQETATPAEIALPPGEYVITFSVDGYEPLSKTLSVVQGEQPQIGADFAAEGTVIPAAGEPEPAVVDPLAGQEVEPQPAPPAPEVQESAGPPPAFWAMAAVTGVGLITGTVFGTMALSLDSDYETNPTTAKQEAGLRDAIIADVSFGIAAAAAIAGTVLLVVHNKKPKTSETADLTIVPTTAPENLGLTAVVRF